MARPLRIEIADGVYHVTSRGLERRAIVRDDRDRARWLDRLGEVAGRRDWRVLAWVLMDNHFHLFVRTPHADLSAGLHDLNSGYVTGFNRRHKRSGPLLQGRFKAILVERDYHYWELSRYIHLNPVRARIVDRPEAHAWGSCGAYFSTRDAPDWLAWEEVLGEYGRTLRTARRTYRRFLMEGIAHGGHNPLADAVAGTLLGSPGFVERMKGWLQDRLPDAEVPAARRLRRRVSMEDIADEVCTEFGVPAASMVERGRHRNRARSAAIYLSRHLTGATIRAIGARFGDLCAARVSRIAAQVNARRARDPEWHATLTRIEKALDRSKK